MSKLNFVNLPIADLEKSTAFCESIGARRNQRFCDDTASCVVFLETIRAIWPQLRRPRRSYLGDYVDGC